MSQALIDSLSSHSWQEVLPLSVLVEKAMDYDNTIRAMRAESQLATENADKVAAAHGIADPATKAARQLEREARVAQTLHHRVYEDLVTQAHDKGWGTEFQTIRALASQAETDPMAAWNLTKVYDHLALEAPSTVRGLAETVDEKLAAAIPSYAEGLKSNDQARHQAELEQLSQARQTRNARTPVDQAADQDADPRRSRASEEENGIGQGERDPQSQVGAKDRKDAKQEAETKARPPSIDTKTIPPHVLENLHRKGTRYVDPSDLKKLVFHDRGNALTTRRDADAASIRTMLDVAEARGWSPLKLTGDEPFRRQAWFAAASRGHEVSGYKPTEAEKAVVAKALEKSDRDAPNGISPGDRAASKAQAAPAAAKQAAPSKDPADAKATRTAAPVAPEKRPVVEILVDHGRANFEHRDDEKPSYFVTTRRGKDEHTYWGIDLERAIAESGAEKGMPVTVENKGKEAVKVEANVRNEEGKVVGKETIETHRNKWEVTAQVNPQVAAFRNATTEKQREQAAKDHPNLANAFAQEAAMKKFADATIVKADRGRFMAEQRKIIERNLADGIALKTVNVRQAPVATKQPRERVAELEQER